MFNASFEKTTRTKARPQRTEEAQKRRDKVKPWTRTDKRAQVPGVDY